MDGEEKREDWANHSGFHLVRNPSLSRLSRGTFGDGHVCTLLDVSTTECSIPAVHVLLSAGADTERRNFQRKLALRRIGLMLPDEKRNVAMEAAVRRMLQKGPAFRDRSWIWPSTMDPPLGRVSNVPPSCSTPVPKTTPTGARIFRPMGERLFIWVFD